MAELVKVRGLNRNRGVRVKGLSLVAGTSKVVDLDDPVTRRDVSQHSALGAIVTMGEVPAAVVSGVVTTAGTGLTVSVSAGSLLLDINGQTVAVGASANFALTAADATNPRLDLITVNNSTGAVAKVDGTAAATPAPGTAAVGTTAIAVVRVNANATAPTSITDVAPRMT
jgi:hypothetical protein